MCVQSSMVVTEVFIFPQGRGTKKAGKRGTNKKGSKKASGARSKSGKASGVMMRGDDLSQKIYTTMDKHKEVFQIFVNKKIFAKIFLPSCQLLRHCMYRRQTQ